MFRLCLYGQCGLQLCHIGNMININFPYPSFPLVQSYAATSNSHINHNPIKKSPIHIEPRPPVLPAHPALSWCSGCSCHGDGEGLRVRRRHCYHGNLGSGASGAGGACSAARQKPSDADRGRRGFQQPSARRCPATDRTR